MRAWSADLETNSRVVLALVCALTGVGVPVAAERANAAPLLRSANIRVVLSALNACDVAMALVVEGGSPVDHRIEVVDGMHVDVSEIRGAQQVRAAEAIGRTRSLLLQTGSSEYELRYSVQRFAAEDKCPLWLPAAPADGVSRAVRIRVELPPGTSARSTMPAFTWNGTVGEATLGHIPAFVRVPYAAAGDSTGWDVSTVMDALTVTVFAAASGIWIWRRRR